MTPRVHLVKFPFARQILAPHAKNPLLVSPPPRHNVTSLIHKIQQDGSPMATKRCQTRRIHCWWTRGRSYICSVYQTRDILNGGAWLLSKWGESWRRVSPRYRYGYCVRGTLSIERAKRNVHEPVVTVTAQWFVFCPQNGPHNIPQNGRLVLVLEHHRCVNDSKNPVH